MRKVSLFKLTLLFCVSLALAKCSNDNSSNSNGVNVAGTWRGPIQVTSCSPSDVCNQAGFQQGLTFTAVMTLQQNGSDVNGSYTYQGANISADVSGNISGSNLTLNGSANNFFGRATVALTGKVNNSTMDSNVSHNITLFDGRSGTVSGTGTLTR